MSSVPLGPSRFLPGSPEMSLWPQSPEVTVQPARGGAGMGCRVGLCLTSCREHREFLQSPHTHTHSWSSISNPAVWLLFALHEAVPSAPDRGPPVLTPQRARGQGLFSPKTPENSSAPRLQVDEERLVKTFKKQQLFLNVGVYNMAEMAYF